MTIQKRKHGKGHSYKIDGEKVPGVTTILNATVPKDALIDWSGRVTAGYAVDNWDELSAMPPSKRLAALNHARFEERDTAANRGTEVHRLAVPLVHGEEIEVPDELAGHVDAYVNFLNTYDPDPILVEGVIGHRGVGYCGSLDLICDLQLATDTRPHRWLLDLKTSRRGGYGKDALQVTGYRYAEVYLNEAGEERPMADLEVERAGIVHIRADGWDLKRVAADDASWQLFRHLAWLYHHDITEIDELIGPAIRPPHVQRLQEAHA